MILVPVKDLTKAKQRLAPVLDQPARTELAQAMLTDVAETLAGWQGRPEVGLITSDPFAVELALRFQFDVIADTVNRGETDAVEMACQLCEQRGVQETLVVPADIPLVQISELEKVLESAPTRGSVLVPSADRRGTNAAWRSPARLFPLRFGNDSFKPHLAAARATHQPCVVLSLPGIALDIDNAFDLAQLASAPGEGRAQRLARTWGFLDLRKAANE